MVLGLGGREPESHVTSACARSSTRGICLGSALMTLWTSRTHIELLVFGVLCESEWGLTYFAWGYEQAVDIPQINQVVVPNLEIGTAAHVRDYCLPQFVGVHVNLVVAAYSFLIVDAE